MTCLGALLVLFCQQQGKLEIGLTALGGAADIVHTGAQQINHYAVGFQLGMYVAPEFEIYGEFDVSYNAPVNRGEHFKMIQYFVAFRVYPGEFDGFFGGLGIGQSWNDNDSDRFDIKQVQTHFNWGLHANVGWRFVLTESTDLLVEIRYSHWSNGSFTGDRNLGMNDLLLGLTLMWK
jgi:hypothetical protein